MPWISFVNPWMLSGLVLAAVPIVIHLLNRRRYRRVEWAAVEFLLQAERRNRRRMQLEEVILLALRVAVVVLVVLLLTRPKIEGPVRLAGTAGQAVEHWIVVDDSPSMGAGSQGRTVFESAMERVGEFLRHLVQQRAGDRVVVAVASRVGEPVCQEQLVNVPAVESVCQRLRELGTSDLPLDAVALGRGLEQMLRQNQTGRARRVYLVSDFRRRDWQVGMGMGNELTKGLAGQSWGRLAREVEALVLIPLGQEVVTNLAVREVRATGTLVAGVPVRLEVRLVNYGSEVVGPVTVSLHVEGAAPQSASLERLAPGREEVVGFVLRPVQAGPLRIEARIGPDALEADNTRYYPGNVRKAVPILIVDSRVGSSNEDWGDGPGGIGPRPGALFLARALAPPGPVPSGYSIEVVGEDALERTDLERYGVVFLVNAFRISARGLANLERFVRTGGGLVVFLGEQVDPNFYNESLYRQGRGLLPCRLRTMVGRGQREESFGLLIAQPEHPVVRVFQGEGNPLLKSVRVFTWWGIDVVESSLLEAEQTQRPPVEETYSLVGGDNRIAQEGLSDGEPDQTPARNGAWVLAWLDSPDRWPMIVERTWGCGRLIVFATSADEAWTNWPADPSYVVTMLETARWVVRDTVQEKLLSPGMALVHVLDPGRYRPQVRVLLLDGESRMLAVVPMGEEGRGGGASREGAETGAGTLSRVGPDVGKEPGSAAGTPILAVRLEEIPRRGFYGLELEQHDGSREEILFAANIDPGEGDLTPQDVQVLAEWIRQAARNTGQTRESVSGEREPVVEVLPGRLSLEVEDGLSGRELFRPILTVVLIVLGLESVLAWALGRRR